MKKIFIALVAMFAMTMSASAQSGNNGMLAFQRLSSYLELTIDQYEPVKMAMRQFDSSMVAFYQLEDQSKAGETWQKILVRHKATIKKMLSKKQYRKYEQILDLTIKNAAERMTDQQIAMK